MQNKYASLSAHWPVELWPYRVTTSVNSQYKEDISDAVPPERRGGKFQIPTRTLMSQTWSSLPRLPDHELVMPPRQPKFVSTMKDDDLEAKSFETPATKELLPSASWDSSEKPRRPSPRVNSKFVVNPSSTGMLHHNWRDRAKKRAESCGPAHTPSHRGDEEPSKWIIRNGNWVYETKPRLSLEDQIKRLQEAGERDLLRKRYTDKVSRPGMMRRWNKRNPFGGHFEVN